jgi:hypothetical protein
MKIKTFKRLLGSVCVAALLISATSASAITYTLNQINIGGFTGPFGTANVSLVNSTHATITFTSNVVGGVMYLFGDGGSVAVNVNATSWTLSGVAGSNSGTGFSPGPFSNGGAGNEDGWGSFNQTINSMGGYTRSSDMISFNLTNLSGIWSSASDILAANASGHFIAAHIFPASYPADAHHDTYTGLTGFATDGAVPDGGMTVMLLGSALAGLAILRRLVASRSMGK